MVSIRAGQLSISFAAHEEDVDFKIETVRARVSAATWTVGSMQLITATTPPRVWRDCKPCVQGMLHGLLGWVPWSAITIDGAVASTLVG